MEPPKSKMFSLVADYSDTDSTEEEPADADLELIPPANKRLKQMSPSPSPPHLEKELHWGVINPNISNPSDSTSTAQPNIATRKIKFTEQGDACVPETESEQLSVPVPVKAVPVNVSAQTAKLLSARDSVPIFPADDSESAASSPSHATGSALVTTSVPVPPYSMSSVSAYESTRKAHQKQDQGDNDDDKDNEIGKAPKQLSSPRQNYKSDDDGDDKYKDDDDLEVYADGDYDDEYDQEGWEGNQSFNCGTKENNVAEGEEDNDDDSDNDDDDDDDDEDSNGRLAQTKLKPPQQLLSNPFRNTGAGESQVLVNGASVFQIAFIDQEAQRSAALERHVKMTGAAGSQQMINGKKICWNFRRGKCRFGHNCTFAHDSDVQQAREQETTNTGKNNRPRSFVKPLISRVDSPNSELLDSESPPLTKELDYDEGIVASSAHLSRSSSKHFPVATATSGSANVVLSGSDLAQVGLDINRNRKPGGKGKRRPGLSQTIQPSKKVMKSYYKQNP